MKYIIDRGRLLMIYIYATTLLSHDVNNVTHFFIALLKLFFSID